MTSKYLLAGATALAALTISTAADARSLRAAGSSTVYPFAKLVAERMARAYDLPAHGMTGEFDFHEYDGPAAVGPFVVEPVPVAHPVPAYGLRVTADGATLAYTGDTGPCSALDRLAAGAGLLLAEASFESAAVNPPDLHLTGADCGRTATRAGVGRLVLTHVPPWHDPAVAEAEARGEWSGPVELARAGATYDV